MTEIADFDALADAWSALAERDPRAHVFQGHAWLSVWLRHQCGAQPRILVARRGERLTAALPLCAHESGPPFAPLRVLRFAADNESDYCAPLSDPDCPEDLDRLWSGLLGRRDWHLADLRYVPRTSPLAELAAANGAKLCVDTHEQDVVPYLDITRDWRESVPKSQRPKLLRRRRQFQEAGAAAFDVAASPGQVDAFLEQLSEMHIARWRGRNETSFFLFANRRARLWETCHRLLALGQLYLCRLSRDGRPVSIGLYYLHGRRLLNTVYSFDEEYRKFGPVHLLVLEAIEDARARNLAGIHDFGRGAEEYKFRWTEDTDRLDRILLARRSPTARAAFWWAANAKPYLWRHQRLGTAVREFRRRRELRRQA